MTASHEPNAPRGGALSVETPPFVGRDREREELFRGLEEAQKSRGSAWIIQGLTGIGKTRLAREAEKRATSVGFLGRWGYCLKEVNTPLFPFLQMFHRRDSKESRTGEGRGLPHPLPSVLFVEEEKPVGIYSDAVELSGKHPMLLLSRERPATIREKHPDFGPTMQALWLTRMEGPDAMSPSNMDALGERLTGFLQSQPQGIVVLTALEYLVTQNGFPAVLRLLQFLRDIAEESEGHLLIAMNPGAFEPREKSLLEGEGEVISSTPQNAPAPPTIEDSTQAMIRYLDTLEEEAPGQPQLLVIDDLQWADPDSLRAFQFLARNVRDLKVVVMATLQTDDSLPANEQQRNQLDEVMEAMDREGTLRRVVLSGLAEQDCYDLVCGLFGVHPTTHAPESGDEGFRRLYVKSGGSPFILKELARNLAEEGILRGEGSRVYLVQTVGDEISEPALPESVQRLLSRELEALPPAEKDLLEWASIVGGEFESAPLAGVLGISVEQVASELRGIERRRGMLERLPERVGRRTGWSFTPHLLCEVVLSQVSPSILSHRAQALGQWWAQNRPDEIEEIARLFHESGNPEPAAAWARKAIDQAFEQMHFESILRFYRWLLEAMDRSGAVIEAGVRESLDLSDRMEAVLGQALEREGILRSLYEKELSPRLRLEVEVRMVSSIADMNPKAARPILDRLTSLLSQEDKFPPADRFRVPLAEATLAMREARYASLLEEATKVLGFGGTLPTWARSLALYYQGVALCRSGRLTEAAAALEQLRRAEGTHPNTRSQTLVFSLDSFLGEYLGDVGRYCRACEDSMRLARSPSNLAIGWNNLAGARIDRGDLEGAAAAQRECQKIVERFDLPLKFLGEILEAEIGLRRGNYAEALPHYLKGCEDFLRQGNLENATLMDMRLAEVHLSLGQLEPARVVLRKIGANSDGLHTQALALDLLYRVLDGWAREVEGSSKSSRDCFEQALQRADGASNYLWEGWTRMALAQWEELHGSSSAAHGLRAEAEVRFTRAGILPDGWARRWPPPFHGKAPVTTGS